jgi:HPr kinase/phosphorylase
MAIVNIHATCVLLERAGAAFGAPAGLGVLLVGRSGSGKSDLALRLIAMGAQLVSDDRTDLYVARGNLCARPPAGIAGLIEVRNVGILKLPHARSAEIGLVVELGRGAVRLPEHRRFHLPPALGLASEAAPPHITIAPFEASAPAKVVAAAAAYALGLHRDDVNPI